MKQFGPIHSSAPPPLSWLSADGGPYRTLVEALDYGVLLFTADATLLVHNASAERVLGLSTAQTTGRAPLPGGWALLHEDGSAARNPKELIPKVLQSETVVRDQVMLVRRPDGRTSWLQISVQPLYNETGDAYAAVASLVDISEQRRAREQLGRDTRFRAQLGALVAASLQDDLGSTFYQRLMEGAVGAIPGAQAGSLLLSGDDGRYYFAAAVNFDQQLLAQVQLFKHELHRDPNVSGPQLIYGFDNSGITEPERRGPLYEAGDTGGIEVSLSVPIEVGGRVVAYFNLDNFETRDAFSADTVQMAELFAQQVAALWRRFRLEAELRQERRALEKLAFFDPLTGLPNRTLLGDRLQQVLLQSKRSGTPVALIFMDLDDFKGVNDSLGHDVGDALLGAVAKRLQSCVRASDTVARWGGDEFVVLLPSITGAEDAAQVARAILSVLREPFTLSGYHLYTGASLGVSVFPDTAGDADDLIKNADTALYRVKAEGKGNFGFFTDGDPRQARPAFRAEVQNALAGGSLELRYTPRVRFDAGTATLTGFSVEAFWPGSQGKLQRRARELQQGLVMTTPLLPLLGEWGLGIAFFEQLLGDVCKHLQVWPQGDERVAVAVPVGLVSGDLVRLFIRTLESFGLEPRRLELSFYGLPSKEDGLQALGALRAAGFHLSLRGFGGPDAPLELLRLPFQSFGIDAGVVADLADAGSGEHQDSSHDRDREDVSTVLVRTAVQLGRTLGAEVYAQGVTSAEQRRVLARLGCTHLEGPLVGAACSGAAAADLLRQSSG